VLLLDGASSDGDQATEAPIPPQWLRADDRQGLARGRSGLTTGVNQAAKKHQYQQYYDDKGYIHQSIKVGYFMILLYD